MSVAQAAHASSTFLAGGRSHDHRPVESFGLGDPDRLDLDQATVATTDVVLAVVQHRAPTGTLERPTIHWLDAFAMASRSQRRFPHADRHGAIVNDDNLWIVSANYLWIRWGYSRRDGRARLPTCQHKNVSPNSESNSPHP